MVRDEQRYEKTLTLKMTEGEHSKIKKLAAERRQSIKGLIFSALDKLIPGWNKGQKKEE